MWQKADERGLDWYKRNVHQDMVSLFLSVHDEVDLVVDRFLLKSIMVELTKVAESKWIFDRFGFPYINFYFDNEYDDWGSFTASGGFNPYKYDLECLRQRLGLVKIELTPATEQAKAEPLPQADIAKEASLLVTLPNDHDKLSAFERILTMVDSGDYHLDIIIDFGNGEQQRFRYDRLVDPKELLKFGALESSAL